MFEHVERQMYAYHALYTHVNFHPSLLILPVVASLQTWRSVVTAEHVLPTNVLAQITVIASQVIPQPPPTESPLGHEELDIGRAEGFNAIRLTRGSISVSTAHCSLKPRLVSIASEGCALFGMSSLWTPGAWGQVLRGKTSLVSHMHKLRMACNAAAPKKLIRCKPDTAQRTSCSPG